MTSIIARRSPEVYFSSMGAALLRLLTLFALVLMPITMTAAPAEAHAMTAMSAADHCGDQQQPQTPPMKDLAQCMLMCAALPAAEALTVSPPDVPWAPRRSALVKPIQGIILEIATPPPRRA